MIKLDNISVMNFEGAFRGMRNPMNSWDKSDSNWCYYMNNINCDKCVLDHSCFKQYFTHDGGYIIGPNDLKLAQKLILAGTEHAKFMRQIFVSVDITAPLYWWKEFDTYKVGTVANSTSTMHKLSSIPITKEMFEFDDNSDYLTVDQGKSICGEWEYVFSDYIEDIVDMCENLRIKFNETGDSKYWRALIQILPSAYLQTRTVTMSYANLRNIYFQRRNHKLLEWSQFCNCVKTLPYSEELIIIE